ncbi:hypothetical protein AC578_9821 [Pseudocercospora eumusae]|uniref:2EXR domain-containing protein n=1 Tax=Pseudocercospora eumusae TaxID=321146 RepID=A0A139H9P2_9PEZI|nr:hypothetical protein AC578_9821 [Pseudocercospora eumusae]
MAFIFSGQAQQLHKWNNNNALAIFAAMANNQRAPFLNLPAELRNDIYRLTLTSEEPIHLMDGKLLDGPGEPALLAVCKQTRHEATRIWYEENAFEYEETSTTFGCFEWTLLADWLGKLGRHRCENLQRLVLSYQAPTSPRSNFPHKPGAEEAAASLVRGLVKAGVPLEKVVVEAPGFQDAKMSEDFRPLWKMYVSRALAKPAIMSAEVGFESSKGFKIKSKHRF